MNRFLHVFAPIVLAIAGLTLAGCAAMQSSSPQVAANGHKPTTQAAAPMNSAGSSYANTDNSDIGNGAFGENP